VEGRNKGRVSSYGRSGKLFEKILLNTILHEVGERGLLRDE